MRRLIETTIMNLIQQIAAGLMCTALCLMIHTLIANHRAIREELKGGEHAV